MAVYYKAFRVTGAVNQIVWDDGLTSTEAEPKHLRGVYLTTSDWFGNLVKASIEREEVMSIYDFNIDSYNYLSTGNGARSTNKPYYFELNIDIPLGRTFRIGLQCGGTATTIYGVYVYEIKAR